MAMLDVNDKELKEAVIFTEDYYKSMKTNFVNVGAETIKNCGIDGDGKAQIIETAKSYEEALNNILNDYANLSESMETYIKDLTGFNATDYFALVRKDANDVSSSKQIEKRASKFRR